MALDIIIVNYRTPGDLDRCLASLANYPPSVPYSVLVMNNGPQPEDVRVAEKWCDQQRIQERGRWDHYAFRNIGYAAACNAGGMMSQSEVIGCFNADVEFTYGTLDACHDALHQQEPDARWGVLGPRQVDRDGRITHAGIFGGNTSPRIRGWKQHTTDYQDLREDATSVSGSAYFVTREVWDSLTRCPQYLAFLRTRGLDLPLGPFLPTSHYYEETWCSYHAAAHGYKIVYWGLHTMVHQWHQASPVGGQAERWLPESQRLFRQACSWHGIPCN